MARPTRWWIAVVFSAIAVIGLVVGLLQTPVLELKLTPYPLYEDMKLMRKALFMYETEHGRFPFDDRGPEYALYKLKPYLSDLPTIAPADAWNDREGRLESVRIEYVNEGQQRSTSSRQTNEFLLCIPVKDRGKLYLTKQGVIFYQPN